VFNTKNGFLFSLWCSVVRRKEDSKEDVKRNKSAIFVHYIIGVTIVDKIDGFFFRVGKYKMSGFCPTWLGQFGAF